MNVCPPAAFLFRPGPSPVLLPGLPGADPEALPEPLPPPRPLPLTSDIGGLLVQV